jgi:hypothetical protein
MKPTPKALTHSLPLVSTSRFAHLCRSRPRGSIRKQAGPTAKQLQRICHDALISSRCPASLVRLKLVRCPHSLAPTLVAYLLCRLARRSIRQGSRTPAVILFNTSHGLSH